MSFKVELKFNRSSKKRTSLRSGMASFGLSTMSRLLLLLHHFSFEKNIHFQLEQKFRKYTERPTSQMPFNSKSGLILFGPWSTLAQFGHYHVTFATLPEFTLYKLDNV
jgi:hypothetical protein